ncbi:hypothetical protein AAFC00_005982 [Neodothiora populina]|uniref:WD40 repeat-like protein n=1 Tax=Neodothiora populina TaxID=2781224 RepID=A0ABR3P6J4_9PEZI
MSGPVDASPVTQGKRKRTQKERTPLSQGSKRVKSTHSDLLAGGVVETPSKPEKAVLPLDKTGDDTAVTPAKRRRRHAPKPQARQDFTATADNASTILTRPTGGRFIAHDPIVSADDGYIFASNGREVQVLSVATSLVERALPGPNRSVSAFALSPSDPETIYIASPSRRIQCWDWVSGTVVNDPIDYKGKIHALCATSQDESAEDLLYTICQLDAEWHILAADKIIYTSKEPLSNLSVQDQYVMATSPNNLIAGRRSASKLESDSEAIFTFVEIASSKSLTCLAGKVQQIEQSKKKAASADLLNVAVGNVEGQIMLYEDVFATTRPAAISLTPRVLHWHREAVASLKWSKDGNYLISGGRETTLVLWQLATGKKQFLPHLTAEIERLTVSPSGTSYAIQLADNSVMLLSTAELKPVANFAGLQAQSAIVVDSVKQIVPSAAVLHPIHQDRLLLAVPPSQTTTSRPFLQTFDITSDRHLSRQALTRNNVTDFNKGPEGNKIQVPDVALIQLSKDGQWLATTEEWAPPVSDLEHLAVNGTAKQQQALRTEVYLKIWRWDAEREIWALETRIDNPHQVPDGACPGRIFDLVSDPFENGFATIGEDSSVRIWKPKTRLRNGLVIRGADAEGLIDWSCRHSMELNHSLELTEEEQAADPAPRPINAKLAYSQDASILAASQVFDKTSLPSLVTFINTARGAIEQTRSSLFTGTLKALSFVDRHIVCISNTGIHLWDIIDQTLRYRTHLASDSSSAVTLLAVNVEDRTFAVSISTPAYSRVRVYNTSSPEPEISSNMHKAVTALMTVPGRTGYTILTSTAELQYLLPKSSTPDVSAAAAVSPAVATSDAMDVVEASEDESESDGVDMEDKENLLAIDDEEADKPVVQPEQLARVFDDENIALMPVRAMFDAVVGLYARKPRANAVA